MNIEGYNKEDVEKLIKRVYKETEENRDRALKLYDHMERAMTQNKGDLIVLSQMADRYLEQASRQTEILVKLGQVIQKLQQYEDKNDPEEQKRTVSDINSLLESLDLAKLSPFVVRENPKPEIKPLSEEAVEEVKESLKKLEENDYSDLKAESKVMTELKKDVKKSQGDIELETDL